MDPSLIIDVIRFETSRSITAGRIAIWSILVIFPVLLFAVMGRLNADASIELWGGWMHFLVTEVTCLLGLLLWATPAISTEIEGQTWVYLAMRQSGRTSVLIGKYLTAVIWPFSAAVVSITASMVVLGIVGNVHLWIVMCVLALLSCLAHGAIFLLIGVFFYRRTMASAVVYTLGIEYGLSFVPAVANKLTVNYRLRGLLVNWTGWDLQAADYVTGNESSLMHLSALAIVTILGLAFAMLRLSRAEYPTQQDG